jgi:hypothetical protein
MRWNRGWFICLLLAGPCAYFTLEALQPSKLLVFAVLFGIPLLGWIASIAVFIFKSLSP